MFIFRKRFWKDVFKFDVFHWYEKWCILPNGGNFGGKAGRFTRGISLTITLSTKCNFRCRYCPMFDLRDEYPRWDESTMDDWITFIETFPVYISHVILSGGEPTFVSYMPELANYLIKTGRKVLIFSNLAKPEVFERIKPSSRLLIYATYHHQDDKDSYVKAFNLVKTWHRIIGAEIRGEAKVLDFTEQKPFITPELAQVYERQFHACSNAPKTRAIYCGAEWLYPERVEWRVKK